MMSGPSSEVQERCRELLQAVNNGDSRTIRQLLEGDQSNLVRYVDSNGNTLLHIACEQKQFRTVGALVQFGVKVQEKNSNGDTALHIAAGGTNKIKVIRLLSTGDTLNSRGSSGRTPLHCACEGRRPEVVDELVSKLKCDVTCAEDEGRTGLHIASAGGNFEIVKVLVAASKDLVKCKDTHGYTALHYACENGHVKIVKFLCEHDADIAVRNCNNETPMDASALKNRIDVVDYILSKGWCCKDLPGVRARTALHHACAEGYVELARVLVDKYSCNVCAEDENKMTPLHLAAVSGTEPLVELLAKASSTVNSVDSLGWTPLHHACQKGHVSTLRTLVRFGAQFTVRNHDGQLAIHLAALNCHMAAIDTLKEYGCDISHRDSQGKGCLHLACVAGCEETVKMLVEKHKCDPDEKDGSGISPIQIAALHGKDRVVALLESTYACSLNESPPNIIELLLQYSCQHGCISILNKVLKLGADPKQRMNPQGWSALHCACKHGHPLVIRELMSHLNASDVNKENEEGHTPLHLAAICGSGEAIMELGTCPGLQVNCLDKAGFTPLHYACCEGHKKAIKAMIALGANLQTCSSKGWTALHSAAYGGQEDTMNMLVNEYNCDPVALDQRHRLPLHIACTGGHVKLVQTLLQKYGYDINCKDNKGITPLHFASSYGHVALVIELVRNLKSELECCDLNGMSAAHYAAFYGHVGVLRALRELGANMDARIFASANDNGLFHLAALNGHSSIIEFLVNECNMDISILGFCGRNVLHCACDKGQLQLLNKLMRTYNLDINAVDDKGWTPLHVASSFGNEDVVRLLLTIPTCKPYITTQDGYLAVEQACIEGHIGTVKTFLEHNAKFTNTREHFSSILHYTCQGGHTEMLRLLIEEWNFDINGKDTKGHTPLHIAILYEKEAVVRLLLTCRCQVNCADSKGCTPLYYAVQKHNLKLVQMLLECEAATEIPSNDGSTALMYAVQQNFQDVFELLLAKSKPGDIFKSMQSLETQKKEVHISKYQLWEYKENKKQQERVLSEERASCEEQPKLKEIELEVAALKTQMTEFRNEKSIAERQSTDPSLLSLNTMPGFTVLVKELAGKASHKWKEVCSKLGIAPKRLHDIELEGYKYCYMIALMDLRESNEFTTAAVINALKSLECYEAANSIEQLPASSDSVEKSLPSTPFVPRSSFNPQTSLASCGRNSVSYEGRNSAMYEGGIINGVIGEQQPFRMITEENLLQPTTNSQSKI